MRTFSQNEIQEFDSTPMMSIEEHNEVFDTQMHRLEAIKEKVIQGSPKRKLENKNKKSYVLTSVPS